MRVSLITLLTLYPLRIRDCFMGSTFGELFRISTFGESHGGAVGVVIEGCPPRLELDLEKIQFELDRRKPGQSKITSPRKEDDRVEILRLLGLQSQ